MNGKYYSNYNDWWELWKSHRNVITELISKKILNKFSDINSVAIFGAGYCNDIDLNFYTENFDIVTLVDINEEGMKEGVSRQSLLDENAAKIKYVGGTDFVGQTDEMYSAFENLLNSRPSVKKVKKFIINNANEISKRDIEIKGLEPHSLVIAVGVHSQLSNLMICLYNHNEINNYFTIKELREITYEMHYYYGVIAKKFNDVLLKYTEKAIFLGFDIIEISERLQNQDEMMFVRNCLENNDLKGLSEFIFNKDCGVSGAFEGYKDVVDRLSVDKKRYLQFEDEGKIVTNFWNWRFDNKKTYIIFAKTILKECF